jgi:hypothetical protein
MLIRSTRTAEIDRGPFSNPKCFGKPGVTIESLTL